MQSGDFFENFSLMFDLKIRIKLTCNKSNRDGDEDA